MINYILFDDATRNQLLPFTHTRPVADIRCGILTNRARWERLLEAKTSTLTTSYLQNTFPYVSGDDNIYINASIIGNLELANAIRELLPGQTLSKGFLTIAARFHENHPTPQTLAEQAKFGIEKNFTGNTLQLNHIWDIFSLNEAVIRMDFDLLTKNKKGAPVPENVLVSGKENLFIEEGASIGMGCIINAAKGPVYIGKNAVILEGAMMHGPLAICENAVVKMGAKIYGGTTIGDGCKVGGEISNVVFFANSNKGHDGYLGNAVVGEWCNLGADTNCSNLKNNYDDVKVWDEYSGKLVNSDLIFCGLFMADHSKCGINTMFNTGTVVGVSANIFGAGFPDKFIPSFSWGGSDQMTIYEFEKAIQTANRMMERRGLKLGDNEVEMLRHIFDNTKNQRQ